MKHIKAIFFLVLVLLTASIFTTTALAYTETAVSGTRYITSSNGNPVNVRTGPGTSYSLAAVGRFETGTKVTLHAKATGTDKKVWYRVTNSAGKGGWARSDFLTTNSGGGNESAGWESRYGSGTLSTGGGNSTRQQIINLQNDLLYLGFNLGSKGADGYYGEMTQDAINKFQIEYGLKVDGMAGPVTKAKLYALTVSNH